MGIFLGQGLVAVKELLDIQRGSANNGGWTVDAQTGGFVFNREKEDAIDGWYKLGNSIALTDVYNGECLKKLYTALFTQSRSPVSSTTTSASPRKRNGYTKTPGEKGGPGMSGDAYMQYDGFNMLPQVTWLRAKGKGEVTADHADYYYFKNNTSVFINNRHPSVTDMASLQAKACGICQVCKLAKTSKQEEKDEFFTCRLCGTWTN